MPIFRILVLINYLFASVNLGVALGEEISINKLQTATYLVSLALVLAL